MEKTKTIKKSPMKARLSVKEKVITPKADKKVMNIKKNDQKLAKVITGTVVSTKMAKTVVVSYTRKVAHKKYGKLIKVTKRIKADTNGMEISLGDTVKIEQTKPMSKDKFFKVIATAAAKASGLKKEEAK